MDTVANNLVKHSGQVFTPGFLVDIMLDFCGYAGNAISGKHVIDNSCGDGAFLCAVVGRYCELSGKSGEQLKSDLETYVHGIEKDPAAHSACLYNLDLAASVFGLQGVKWDVLLADALVVECFDAKMDFVVGNPPYVRVHNLHEDYEAVKRFRYADAGMTDLYLAFFELGLRMLNPAGVLCYVTPSSWLSSKAAAAMRRDISRRRSVEGVIDLGHYQAFEGVTTYALVTLMRPWRKHEKIGYNVFDGKLKHVCELSYDDFQINGQFYLAPPDTLRRLRNVRTGKHPKYVAVKNGFATLADSVFIADFPFDDWVIPVLKASTGRWARGFFPYDRRGKPLKKEEIFANPAVSRYLLDNREKLLKGYGEDDCPDWWLYGRTQALKDVWTDKLAVNTLVRGSGSLKINKVPAGAGLYSGLYILSKEVPFEKIEAILSASDFIDYVSSLKNYKSGGYYTFSSQDLEMYINYKVEQDAEYEKNNGDVKSGIFACGD